MGSMRALVNTPYILLCHDQIGGGGPIAFAGFGAAENKGIAFGVSLGLRGHRFGGFLSLLGFCCMIPISYGIPSLNP